MPSFAVRQFQDVNRDATGSSPGPIDLSADNGPNLNAVLWVLVSCSGIFLVLRIYCKFLKHRGLWWDDYVLTASWVCLTIDAAMATSTVALGYGKHMAVIPPANFPLIFLQQNIGASFAITAAVWSKTSFGMTLLRVTEGKVKAAVWFIILSMNVAMGLSALLQWVQCSPIQKTWDSTVPGTCWPQQVNLVFGIFAGAYSGAMDIILALLPWKIVWNLQMKRKEKVGVAFAMSMGVFAGATAFIKCAKLMNIASSDFTFDGTQLSAWGAAEVATTIMAASIPVLRVLVREVKTSAERRYGYGNYGSSSGTRSGTRHGGGGTVVHGGTNTVTVSISGGVVEGGNRTRTRRSSGGVKILKSATGAVSGDDRSDKSILDVHVSEGRILHTREVAVEYQDGMKRDGGDEYEMGRIA